MYFDIERNDFLIIRREKKVKIVNCCGYDCIPSDLGVQMMVEHVLSKPNMKVKEVRLNVGDSHAGVSGGTMASVT